MCGRYGRWSRRQRIEELVGIERSGLDDFPDPYNITPDVETWIVRAKRDADAPLLSVGPSPILVKGPQEGG
jgi:hypothetical protein